MTGSRKEPVPTRLSKKRSQLKRGYLIMSADRHVFNLLTVLGLAFLALYLLGTSLPGWFIVEEYVNTSACASASRYVSNHVNGSRKGETSKLYIASSLWYLNIRLEEKGSLSSQYWPFLFLPKSYEEGNHVLCSGLLGIITFTLLVLGIVFTMNASTKPSKMVYYGLSQISIVTAASTWMMASFEASQNYVTSVARDFCLEYILLSTSLSLQIMTGACAVLAFIMGCVLMHLSSILHSKVQSKLLSRTSAVTSETEPEVLRSEDEDDLLLLDV